MNDLLVMVIDTTTGYTVCTLEGDAEIYDAKDTIELLENTVSLLKELKRWED